MATMTVIENEIQCGQCGREIVSGERAVVIEADYQENGWAIGASTQHARCWRRVARLIRKADR